MIKQIVFVLLICAALVWAQDCEANVSGPNVASPARRRNIRASTTCQADVSGPNVASPARGLRQAQQCSGNGYCDGANCVCLSGYSGDDCQTAVPSTSCQADVSGPNVASPAKRQAQSCSGNGSCTNGQCVCNAGFYGADCEVPVSSSCVPADVSGPNVASPARKIRQSQVCSGHGFCVGSKACVCNAGWSGSNCETAVTTCAPATTTAAPTTAAPTTAAPTTAAPTTAAPTTEAPTTAAPTTAAPTTAAPTTAAPTTAAPTTAAPTTQLPPSGSCSGTDVSGPNVASPARKNRQAVCSGHGYCAGNSCACVPGWEGAECEVKTPSKTCSADVSGPNVASPARKIRQAPCNGNGQCNNGQCTCNAGFIGADCEVPVSSSCVPADVSGPNVASPARSLRQSSACSGNGYCLGQICVCNAGFSGSECSTGAAPSTAAPTTAAPTATENISGDNNARADSGAEKIISIGGIIVAIAVALF